jgi:WD40 repeat protein
VWDITGKKVLTVLDVTATIRTLAFSPDGRFLAGRDETGRIYIWGIPVTAN